MIEEQLGYLSEQASKLTFAVIELREQLSILMEALRRANESRATASAPPAKGKSGKSAREKKPNGAAAQAPGYTYEDVAAAVNAAVNQLGTQPVIDVLAGFGVKSARELDRKDWAAVISQLQSTPTTLLA